MTCTLDEGLRPLLAVAEVTVADGVRQGGHQVERLVPSIREKMIEKVEKKSRKVEQFTNIHATVIRIIFSTLLTLSLLSKLKDKTCDSSLGCLFFFIDIIMMERT
jgi:hypothetical protein